MYSTNSTLLLDAAVVQEPTPPVARDRTADIARIVRHALKAGAASTPLDRAIRSAVSVSGPAVLDSADADDRAGFLARRLNVLLARRTAAQAADPHRETVRV